MMPSIKRFFVACREVSTYSPLIFRGDVPPEVRQKGGIMKIRFSAFLLKQSWRNTPWLATGIVNFEKFLYSYNSKIVKMAET